MTTTGQCKVVDELIDKPKTIAAIGDWTDNHRRNERRLALPLAIDSTVIDMELVVKAFPNHEEQKFTILLAGATCVWRLCFATDTGHLNDLRRPNGLPLGPFDTPHYHSWADNRLLSRTGALPKILRYANFLPASLVTFSDCFQWFCAETNILIGNGQEPKLPPPDRLI